MLGGERSKNIGRLKGRSKRFVGNVRVYFSKRLPAPPAKFYFQMSPSRGNSSIFRWCQLSDGALVFLQPWRLILRPPAPATSKSQHSRLFHERRPSSGERRRRERPFLWASSHTCNAISALLHGT